jgi:hypothetical protein
VTDEKNPADRAIELFVFAPLGLVLSARELLPELVERGRQQLNGQVTLARMIGQMAVKQGTSEAEKALERARVSAQSTLEQLGMVTPPPAPPATPRSTGAATAPSPAPTPAPPATAPPTPPDSPAPPPAAAAPAPERDEATGPADLAIPDYDSLSASQVLPRLSGLSPSELEAVRAHESTHRGRKTILSKVAQLQVR